MFGISWLATVGFQVESTTDLKKKAFKEEKHYQNNLCSF